MKPSLFILLLVSFFSQSIFGQGDGPRAFLLAPKGVTGVNVKWLNLDQNIIPAGTALIPGADIHVNVFPITVFHTFSIAGHFAQAYAMVNPGSATARAKIGPPIGPIPVNELNATGLSDGFVAFKVGLKGAPALNLFEFAKSPMRFSIFADARLWYSGTYSAGKLFNLGTNRMTFQLGLPMAIPLNQNRKRATWLEVAPSIQIYGANNDPSRSSSASKVEQSPLFVLENHLSRNFSPKFWGVANLRFQYGGQTSADDVKDDNIMSIMGAGIGMGYQLLPPLGIAADYGGIVFGDNQARSKMLRLSVVFTYANIKKLKAQTKPVLLAAEVTDADADGISDAEDKCPNMAGFTKYGGCPIPDSDGDAINDEEDKCPNVAGILKYSGCPIPDTDGDDINDEEDKCPAIAGLSKYGGCPVPDTDGDGINDETDKCPRLAGTPGNLGCPEMILLYKRAEAVLSAEDKLKLDTVVRFLEANPDLSIIIEGHTSTLGATDYNQKLSEKRASNSVMYIVSKGISPERLKSVGYGEHFPIGDNATEEGRAQSRRTVIRIAQ